jgi:protein involved in sex pheromone biosynthesis
MLRTTSAFCIILTSAAISSLYIEYYARKNILSKIESVMKDSKIKSKVKKLSEKTLRRLLVDDKSRELIVTLALIVLSGSETRKSVIETLDRNFSEQSLDKLTFQASKKFSMMLLKDWTSSENFEEDW